MKSFKPILSLMVLRLIVSSCTSAITPTGVEKPPTILPSEPIIPTTLPLSLSSPAESTPLPILSPDEAREMVKELLENNAGCKLPCWWGITPGKTTWLEARNFLESFAVYVGETGGVRVPLPSPYSNATYMEHGYFIRNGIVEYIRVFNFNLAPNYYLPKFLETYGVPEEIYIRTFAQEEMGIQNFTVDLFYQNLGVLIEYSTGEPLREIDDKLQNCMIKEMDSPFIHLWSPETQNLSFQEAKRFIDTTNLPEPKPLLDATRMDVQTFYETFKNPDTVACLETPKDLWP
jgi:hypothetical protein